MRQANAISLKRARELAQRELGTAAGLCRTPETLGGHFEMRLGRLRVRIRPDMSGDTGCVELTVSAGGARLTRLFDPEREQRARGPPGQGKVLPVNFPPVTTSISTRFSTSSCIPCIRSHLLPFSFLSQRITPSSLEASAPHTRTLPDILPGSRYVRFPPTRKLPDILSGSRFARLPPTRKLV